MQMNVSLPPQMYQIVQDKVKSGLYSNASEVVRDALRRLDEDQRNIMEWKQLNSYINEGENSGRSAKSVTDIVNDVLSDRNS